MIKCDYWFPRGIWHKEDCGLDTDHFNEFATIHRGAMSGRKASNEGGLLSPYWEDGVKAFQKLIIQSTKSSKLMKGKTNV